MSDLEERVAAIESRLNSRALPERGDGKSAVGAVMRQRRKAAGLPMHEVTSRGGPSAGFQSEIESGRKSEVGLKTFIRWCQAIGCSPTNAMDDILEAMEGSE